jgi:hypothetical protein
VRPPLAVTVDRGRPPGQDASHTADPVGVVRTATPALDPRQGRRGVFPQDMFPQVRFPLVMFPLARFNLVSVMTGGDLSPVHAPIAEPVWEVHPVRNRP